LFRSSCSLRRIAFHHVSLTGDNLLECIAHSPSLVELELRGLASHSITDEVLSRLVYQDNESAPTTCLAPALRIIEIDAYDTLNKSLFLEMVETRRQIRVDSPTAVSQLTRVAVSLPYAIGQLEHVMFARPHVRQLRDEGLDISIVQHFEGGSSYVL